MAEESNTYALLVPHPSLFSPDILELLHEFYSKFGSILHWAPVKGLGRVIVVWADTEAGRSARHAGGGCLTIGNRQQGLRDSSDDSSIGKQGLTLRLFPLPPTTQSVLTSLARAKSDGSPSHDADNPDPTRLAPPAHLRNFLISPPGSPPEGWEPIVEDAPNDQTLALDLIKALDTLQVDRVGRGFHKPKWIGSDDDEESRDLKLADADIILETSDGFTVAVQAPEEHAGLADDPVEQVEYLFNSSDGRITTAPIAGEKATVDSMYGRYQSEAGWRTPGLGERTYSGRPVPTARPPIA